MTLAPTLAQIRLRLESLWDRWEREPELAVAISSEVPWTGPDAVKVKDWTVPIAWCPSSLAIREILVGMESQGRTVILTDRRESELGQDVLARLLRRRLIPLDQGQMVQESLGVQRLDSRLSRHRWILEALIELRAAGILSPVGGPALDLETSFRIVLHHRFAFPDSRPDLRLLLDWSRQPEGPGAYREAVDSVRQSIRTFLTDLLGPLAGVFLDVVEKEESASLPAIGWLLGILTEKDVTQAEKASIDRCWGRLEGRLHLSGLDPAQAELWARVAQEWGDRQRERQRDWPGGGVRAYEEARHSLDRWILDLGIQDLDHHSAFSPRGLDSRMERFAEALEAGSSQERISSIRQRAEDVRNHVDTQEDPSRQRHITMATRLARFLETPAPDLGGRPLARVMQDYINEGSFVDRAREDLRHGEGIDPLAKVLARFLKKARDRGEAANHRFARLMVESGGAVPETPGVHSHEELLARLVSRLPRAVRVLVVVLDGMSFAVGRDLVEDLEEHRRWVTLIPEDVEGCLCSVAPLPTTTEVARTSLLTGVLQAGNAAVEKSGFPDHPVLVEGSTSKTRPRLFHKGDLKDGEGGLAVDLREALNNTRQRVVGVVINAIDDSLARGGQVAFTWTVDRIPQLRDLMEEARRTDRIVLLTSDHGHVLDYGTQQIPSEDTFERHRFADSTDHPQEVVIQGPRVDPGSGRRVVLPSSETVRYSGPRNGYHGGLTLPEALSPVFVLRSTTAVAGGSPGDSQIPDGWREAPLDEPYWWAETPEEETPLARTTPPPPVPTISKRDHPDQGVLPVVFDPPDTPGVTGATVATDVPEAVVADPLVDRLLACELFQEQVDRNRRTRVDEPRLRGILNALLDRGGRMTLAGLSQILRVPAHRLSLILNAIRRVLNVEGYAVLEIDHNSQTVTLNRELLEQQFELGGGSP